MPPFSGGDPIVSYDSAGAGLFGSIGSIPDGFFRVWRSTDGGLHWNSVAKVPGGLYDREYLAVDLTSGPYAGRLYVAGTITVRQTSGDRYPVLAITYSTDNGVTVVPAVFLDATSDGQPGGFGGAGDLLITSRGTLIVPFQSSPNLKPSPNRQFWTLISENGGRTYSTPRPGLPMGRGPAGFRRIKTAGNMRAAIDQSKSPFADRIYVIWVDFKNNRYDVKVTHSDDLGLTWSAPVTVNDNAGPDDPSNAAIAVNRDGVVSVIWNDRRDDPKNECYRLYASASLDGGDTFFPNVQVSPHPTCTNAPGNWLPNIFAAPDGIIMSGVPDRFANGGETQGLVAGPDGRFNVTWINGETGVMQIWYTDLTVQLGTQTVGVRRVDRTKDVSFQLSAPVIDFASKSLGFTVSFKNQSLTPIPAPIKLVVDQTESDFEGLTAVNADNGLPRKGATWTFSLSGRPALLPGEVSETREVRWRFDGQIPPEPRIPFRGNFRVFSEPGNATSRGESRK